MLMVKTYINVIVHVWMKPLIHFTNEPRHEKSNNLGSDQVRHKPGCTVTEDGQRLEISDLESRGIVLSV